MIESGTWTFTAANNEGDNAYLVVTLNGEPSDEKKVVFINKEALQVRDMLLGNFLRDPEVDVDG